MKQLIKSVTYRAYMLFTLLLVQTLSWAQEGNGGGETTVKVTKTQTESENWYAAPWVWAVGAVLLILLLMVLLRGNRGTRSGDNVTVTKTVTRERDDI